VVGGAKAAISTLPWQVFVQARVAAAGGGVRTYSCGGTIRNATTILTAAHISRDDVALLTLSTGLAKYGSATERPAAFAPAGATPATGSGAALSGYGRQSANPAVVPDGNLYRLDVTVGDPYACAGFDDAVITCVASGAGSACRGDSGGPLWNGGGLIGVASFIRNPATPGGCGAGSVAGYANLAAGEVRDWIAAPGAAPPRAPVGGAGVRLAGVPRAGSSLTCTPGPFAGAPAFAYAFVDTRNGAVLQGSPSGTYRLRASDAGRTVSCVLLATNAGGTTSVPTVATPPIAPPPPAPVLKVRLRAAHASGRAHGTVRYALRAANAGNATATAVVACVTPGKGLAFRRRPHHVRRHGRAGYCWHLGSIRAGRHDTAHFALRLGPAHRAVRRTIATSIDSAQTAKRTGRARLLVRPAKRG